MVSKILKYEFISLFFITLLSFAAFYFKGRLPDNIFLVSSSADSINFFIYYFSSIIAIVGYVTGPWIFFPFFLFAVFYTFQYSRRDYRCDLLNIFFLLGACLLCTYLFFPVFLGTGIHFALKTYLSKSIWSLLLPTLILAFLAGSYRGKFKNVVVIIFQNLKSIPKQLWISLRKSEASNLVKNISLWTQKLKSLQRKDSFEDSKNKEKFKILSPGFLKLKERFIKKSNAEKKAEIPIEEANPKQAKENIANGVSEDQFQKVIKSHGKSNLVEDYFALINKVQISHKREFFEGPDDNYFDNIINRIENKLSEFKIEGQIINILKGPVVDTFELELGPGVKVSKVINHTQDLSLALYGTPLRIVYPMKGRTTMGIEVPRTPREVIYLEDVLKSREFKEANAHLPIVMGKNAFGDTFIADLASMPHMLVAGATGAGKSVFINSLLISLLVKKSPKDMKLILIDPKQLELVLYSKLPHLVMPVVTEAKMASLSLMWACQEMERRYSILKEMGVRNIDGFNKKINDISAEEEAKIRPFYKEGEDSWELPYLVIIIDEFADLILTKAGKEIENNICRLAAKARAGGIHLIISTQRPSVDVITGLIKSNFPTRVSFKVTTSVDSRIILNSVGAELLLGNGDLLFKAGIETSRVHSAYVNEKQIEGMTAIIGEMEGEFHTGAINYIESEGSEDRDPYSYGSHIHSSLDKGAEDSLFKEAVRVVMEHRSASASMLQRRLRIGYNRAANLIEELEAKGIVGEAQGSKPREVLSSIDSLE